jgi:hypothetical protein
MFKKICIAVFVGALLSPVGLALSNTGGKGVVRGGNTNYCSKKARAAGGTHPICTTTRTSTVTKYKTVTKPVTTTRYTNRTTTSTKYNTYTVTSKAGGGEVVVTEHVTSTDTVPGKTFVVTETEKAVTTTTAPTSTYTDVRTTTSTDKVTTTQTVTKTVTVTLTEETVN